MKTFNLDKGISQYSTIRRRRMMRGCIDEYTVVVRGDLKRS